MTDSDSLPEADGAEREALLTRLKKLGLTSDDVLTEMSAKSPEDFQGFIVGLLDTNKELQENCGQLITIKEMVEKYLSRLMSEMLGGTDVVESLRRGVAMYPSLESIRWMVGDGERDVTEPVKDSDLDGAYVLPILSRWQYEYKPLNDVWWELERREEGRQNSWTCITSARYYNDLRRMPLVYITLMSRRRMVWDTREDVDDVAQLAAALLRICLRASSERRENIAPIFVNNMRDVILEIEEILENMKALPVLCSQDVSEDSSDIQ